MKEETTIKPAEQLPHESSYEDFVFLPTASHTINIIYYDLVMTCDPKWEIKKEHKNKFRSTVKMFKSLMLY